MLRRARCQAAGESSSDTGNNEGLAEASVASIQHTEKVRGLQDGGEFHICGGG
jgi:hypothetical protein